MRKRSDGFPARRLVTALALVCSAAMALAAAKGPAPSPASGPAVHPVTSHGAAPPAGQTTGLVGDDTCTTCHDSEAKALHQTLHGKAQNVRTPAARTGQACETCHGPGQKHVDSGKKEDIRRFTAMTPRTVNETCLTCHNKGSHANF